MSDETDRTEHTPDAPAARADRDENRVVIVMPDGMGVGGASGHGAEGDRPAGQQGGPEHAREQEHERTNPADLVEEPAKVMRIGSMIKQLLDEVRNAPLDEAGRRRLADIHHRSIEELKAGLAPELVEELDRIALPFSDESPSDPELRIAQAQLVGWLEGLFHGIQTALVAQQMAAQQQLQQMRALPAPGASYGNPTELDHGERQTGPTGQYL